MSFWRRLLGRGKQTGTGRKSWLSAAAYNNRGVERTDRGDLKGAIADLTHALKLDKNYAIAYCNRGRARWKKRDMHGAIADLTRAIEIDPNDSKAYFHRALARTEIGQLDGAISDYTRTLETSQLLVDEQMNRGQDGLVRQGFADVYLRRGRARLLQDDMEGAIADMEEALKLSFPGSQQRKDLEKLLRERKAHTRVAD